MPQQIRMWEVTPGDSLVEITSSGINLEQRLESWLESDISMLDPDLMVIGRQVRIPSIGTIDLLCMDSNGDLVVIELKRGQTPREVTTQALDYASWAKDLSFERIRGIANGYLSSQELSLAEAFEAKFGQPLPSALNESHRSLIVAESMDTATERIVRYLSDMNVPVNIATVQHFKDSNGREMLAQVFLVEPEEAQAKAKANSKRTTGYRTVNQLQALADENGVGELYRRVRDGVRRILNATPYGDTVGYIRRLDDGRTRTVMFIGAVPASETGGIGFTIHADRFGNYFGIDLENLKAILPENISEATHVRRWPHDAEEDRANVIGLDGAFHTVEEVDKFIDGLRAAAGH